MRFLENSCTHRLRTKDFHENSLSVLFFNVRQSLIPFYTTAVFILDICFK